MRKTSNYGLILYDTTDKMSITASENSLNANMEIIDSKLKEIADKPSSSGTVSGLTTNERNTLIEVINAIGVFNVDNGQELIDNFNEAWSSTIEKIPATAISLNKSSLEFTSATSQTLIATVTPTNTTDKIIWSSNNNGVATVSNGVVSPVSNGSCVITAKAGNYSATCNVTINIEEEVKTYTITNNLTNVTSSNNVTSIMEGSTYNATLSASSGYILGTVTVKMGGTDITSSAYSNGVINISSVTGNIVITATATQEETGGGTTTEITDYSTVTGNFLNASGKFQANVGYNTAYFEVLEGETYTVTATNGKMAIHFGLVASGYAGETTTLTLLDVVKDDTDSIANRTLTYTVPQNGCLLIPYYTTGEFKILKGGN